MLSRAGGAVCGVHPTGQQVCGAFFGRRFLVCYEPWLWSQFGSGGRTGYLRFFAGTWHDRRGGTTPLRRGGGPLSHFCADAIALAYCPLAGVLYAVRSVSRLSRTPAGGGLALADGSHAGHVRPRPPRRARLLRRADLALHSPEEPVHRRRCRGRRRSEGRVRIVRAPLRRRGAGRTGQGASGRIARRRHGAAPETTGRVRRRSANVQRRR